jgi:hydroxymethylbilane synthase
MISAYLLRLGTRGSLLARTQSGQVADSLRQLHPGLTVELITISTSGDRFTDQPLADAGGKGLFTKELELALLADQIDLAVHSFKDVPVTMPLVNQADLIIAAVPQRQDPRDALVSHKVKSLIDLPHGATVGTGSLRRRCQILQVRPDLKIMPLRGNIDTRLKKLQNGEYDAIVLAMAGLKRIGRFDPSFIYPIDTSILLPAAGQGALALQCRRGDQRTVEFLSVLNDPATSLAVTAERAVIAELGGDCHSPLAALAVIDGPELTLTAAAGQRDGATPVVRASAKSPINQWIQAVRIVCQTLQNVSPII